MNSKAEPFSKHIDKSGVLVVKSDTVKPEPFDTGREGDKVFLTDIVTLDESPRMGAGIMEMDHCSFPWTLKYDEFDYVIDGVLEIKIDGSTIRGEKGDIIHIPANSSIEFSTPETTRFAYFVYPANWSEI